MALRPVGSRTSDPDIEVIVLESDKTAPSVKSIDFTPSSRQTTSHYCDTEPSTVRTTNNVPAAPSLPQATTLKESSRPHPTTPPSNHLKPTKSHHDPAASSSAGPSLFTSRAARFVLSLRFLLSVFCIVAIVITTVVAWLPTYTAGINAIESLAKDFQNRLAPLVVDSITVRLTRVESMVTTNKYNFAAGLFTTDRETYMPFFKVIARTNPHIVDAFITPTTGGCIGYYHDPASGYDAIWDYNETTINQTEFFLDENGNPTDNLSWYSIDDGLSSQWYIIVDPSQPSGFWWTLPYVWGTHLFLTFTTGIYSPNGTFLGMAGSDMTLGFMDAILASSTVGKGYSVMVVDIATENVLAASPPVATVKCLGGTGTDCTGGTWSQIKGVDVPDQLTMGIFKVVQGRYGQWRHVKSELIEASVNGQDFLFVFYPFTHINIWWCVLLSVEKDVLLASVESESRKVIIIIAVVICAIALVAVVFAHFLIRPLSRLCVQMLELAQMDVSKFNCISANSFLTELRDLVVVFSLLVANLKEYRKFMPDSLFASHDPYGSDDENEDHEGGAAKLHSHLNPPNGHGGASSRRSLGPKRGSVSSQNSNGAAAAAAHIHKGGSRSTPRSSSDTNSTHGRSTGFVPTVTLVSRTVAVACVDVVGFNSIAKTLGLSHLVQTHHKFIAVVHEAVTSGGGLLDKVIGDRAFAFWNAAKKCSRPELKAVQCAFAILHRLNVIVPTKSFIEANPKEESHVDKTHNETMLSPSASSPPCSSKLSLLRLPDDPQASPKTPLTSPAVDVRIGIASSLAHCGNMGSDSVRMFTVVGPAIGEAVMVQKAACKAAKVPVLLTEAVLKQVDCHVQCRPILVMVAPTPIGSAAVIPCYQPMCLYDGVANDNTTVMFNAVSNEWMYELHAQQQSGGGGTSTASRLTEEKLLFDKYCRSVRSTVSGTGATELETDELDRAASLALAMAAPDSPSYALNKLLLTFEAEKKSPNLIAMIREYPQGLKLPFTF